MFEIELRRLKVGFQRRQKQFFSMSKYGLVSFIHPLSMGMEHEADLDFSR